MWIEGINATLTLNDTSMYVGRKVNAMKKRIPLLSVQNNNYFWCSSLPGGPQRIAMTTKSRRRLSNVKRSRLLK